MWDYWKCVFANKATLGGYMLIATSVAGMVLKSTGIIDVGHMTEASQGAYKELCSDMATAGMVLSYITSFGIDTMTAYRRTRKHIAEHRTIHPEYEKKYGSGTYCDKAGYRLAVKEARLENLL